MKMVPHSKKTYWVLVFLWVGTIYSTLYIVRPICEYLRQTTPFVELTYIFSLIFLALLLLILWKKFGIKYNSTYVLLSIGVLLYIFGLIKVQYPEEKIHLIEYGILAFFSYKALSFDLNKPKAFLVAYLLTSFFGFMDEVIQHILPNRFYQNEDVLLNSLSGLLGLFFTFVIQRDRDR